MAKKTEKVEECSSNTCLKHPTGEQVNWEQVGAMIGYKRGILEFQIVFVNWGRTDLEGQRGKGSS